jgi:hypothetical protein
MFYYLPLGRLKVSFMDANRRLSKYSSVPILHYVPKDAGRGRRENFPISVQITKISTNIFQILSCILVFEMTGYKAMDD